MTDQPPQTILPPFSPVPREKDRANGWKPEVQRAFIEALAETGSVRSACRKVGRSEVGAYLIRRHPQAADFRAAWDAALDIGMRRIEDVAMDRALHGVEVPVYSYGKLVGSRTVYNDRLVMFMLRNRAPDRFTGGKAKAMNATDKDTLARLKKQWREEWAAEFHTAHATDSRAASASFIETIKRMHRRWFTGMSPATRTAYRAFRQLEDARDIAWMRGPDADAAMAAAEAEYEEWFGEGKDRRAHNDKLVDMRTWPRGEHAGGEHAGGEETPQ